HQVKIRGYRIETGEIEAVLHNHPQVSEALVIPRGEGTQVRLAAYVVPRPGADAFDSAAFTAYCRDHLPDYMVPGSFTELAALPLNANGKVDRGRLPDPVAQPGPQEDEGPLGPVAELVQEIWREVAGIEAGPRDNFFHSGGNSILAIRLIAAIQDEFGVTLSVRALFEGPTVLEMAQQIENEIRSEIDTMSDAEVLSGSETKEATA
ncbi:phosphopantetheine-binding protein, partial [Streptomyces sp. CC219B]